MANNLIPTKSPIEEVLEKLNLPHLLAGEAGKAISRLVGESLDVMSVWIHRYTQSVKDGTEARQVVSKAIAEVVAKNAASSPELVARATNALVAREFRKQANREAVAEKALEHLAATKESPSADENPRAPNDDWMNIFSRHAGDASSERLQDMWGRVLAGEIRKPGSFSLKTLGFVAELDQQIAALFQWHADYIVVDMIPDTKVHNEGNRIWELAQLGDFGLVTGVGGILA